MQALKVNGKIDGTMHKAILGENLLKAAKDPRQGQRFPLQQGNNPKATARATVDWQNKAYSVVGIQRPGLNPNQNLRQNIKTDVQTLPCSQKFTTNKIHYSL